MADNSQKIVFKDIDYQGLKEGLIDFLKTTQTFKDANFEGTFLSQLVNMFSYTGAIFGNYINAMTAEGGIQTCQLYETANMLGHLVGYKAHGFRGAKTSITITPDFKSMGINNNISNYYGWTAAFPKATKFSTKRSNSQNKSLIFSNTTESVLTIKDPALDPEGNANLIALELVQGVPLTIDFVSDGTALQSFEIPNPFIDYQNITVYVLNESSAEEKWESALTIFHSDSNSKVYVPYVNPKGLLEILFGEGNFGKIPEAGKTIRIEYFATQGAAGTIDAGMINSIIDNIYFVSDDYSESLLGKFTIVQANASTEGIGIETLDRIKKFAPLYYGIQNRLVNHFDYEAYVLGEYDMLVDAKAFNYQEAVEAKLLRSPCENELYNSRWSIYRDDVDAEGNAIKIPLYWDIGGFYQAFTVNRDDILPLPNDPAVDNLLNSFTDTALFVNTTRPCNDTRGAMLSQTAKITPNDTCCTLVHFEVEVMHPEVDETTGEYPEVTNSDLSLYINGEACFLRIDPFVYNPSGYLSNTCCCDREGDVRGWYSVKGVAILDNSYIDSETNLATVLGSIVVQPNKELLLGDARIYPASCLNANDVFVVPVPETGGYLNIETRKEMIEKMNQIKMVCVRNNILLPIYQPFDVRVIFKKDETSVISLEEVVNSIRSQIVEIFLPRNRKLGDTLNTIDLSNEINTLPGVARAKVQLTPRAEYLKAQTNELGDFTLNAGDFPILGEIQLG